MSSSSDVYDFIGIGLGPANLALAVAAHEDDVHRRLRYMFIEREGQFSWHPGMLLADVRMQTPFLKDLVTLRNPRSRFSFVNFLSERGRLQDFIDMRLLFPLRAEYAEYLSWAAEAVRERVRYGVEATCIRAVESRDSGEIETLSVDVRSTDGSGGGSFLARNVVVGAGSSPKRTVAAMGRRVSHSHDLQKFLKSVIVEPQQKFKVIVVGGGQSAAECVHHLLNAYPHGSIEVFCRGFAFRSLEENSYVNNLFSHGGHKTLSKLSPDARELVLADLRYASYSGADKELIDAIFERAYVDRISGLERLTLNAYHDFVEVTERDDHVVALFKSRLTKEQRSCSADILVLATGYEHRAPHALLSSLDPLLERDEAGGLDRDEDYRIRVSDVLKAGIYLHTNWAGRRTITDGTMANLGPRSGAILGKIAKSVESHRSHERMERLYSPTDTS